MIGILGMGPGEITATVRVRAVGDEHAVPVREGGGERVGVAIPGVARQGDAQPLQIGHHHLRRADGAGPLERVAAPPGARAPPQSLRRRSLPQRLDAGRQRLPRQRALQRQLPPQLGQRHLRPGRR